MAERPDGYALELRGVGKRFGRSIALDNVTLGVRAGTVFGLCGENGAGKSTLVKILDGQYPGGTFTGELLVGGEPVSLGSSADALARGIAVVPQETHVVGTMTVAQNIVIGAVPRFRPVLPRRVNAEIGEFLDSIGIDLDPRQPADELSMSSKQLLMIARALYRRPTVLLLDEPTTALTESEIANLHRLVRELAARGVTIVMISHKLEEIFELCDDVGVLRDGELVGVFDARSLTQDALVRAMTGKDIADLYPSRAGTPADAVALTVTDLVVAHPARRHRRVVDGVGFVVRSGEILGIGGALGSGRSETLLAIAGGIHRSGEVIADGVVIPAGDPPAALRAGITMLTEDRKSLGLLFNLTVGDNMTLAAMRLVSRWGLTRRVLQDRIAAEQVARFSIAGATSATPPAALSGGNQQKVLLSRAIVPNPRIVLLDEPTKGVDVGAKADIYRAIADLADSGVAVVLVSSELPELLGNCDRILLMRNGRVEAEFRAGDVTREQLLAASMTGSADALQDVGGAQ